MLIIDAMFVQHNATCDTQTHSCAVNGGRALLGTFKNSESLS